MKNSFSRIGAKKWNSIPGSDRAPPKYKYTGYLIREDTYVGVRTLFDIFSKY